MRYWVYINNSVLERPFSREELPSIIGFTRETLICPEVLAPGQTQEWLPARVLLEPQIQQPAYPPQPQPYFEQSPYPVQYGQPAPTPAANASEREAVLIEKIDNLSKELQEIKDKLFSLSASSFTLPPVENYTRPEVEEYKDPLQEVYEQPSIPQEPVIEEEIPSQEEPEPVKEDFAEEEIQDIPTEDFTSGDTESELVSQPQSLDVKEDDIPLLDDVNDENKLSKILEVPTVDAGVQVENDDFLQEAIKTTFTKRDKKPAQKNDEIIDLARKNTDEEKAPANEDDGIPLVTGEEEQTPVPVETEHHDDDIPSENLIEDEPAQSEAEAKTEEAVEEIIEDIPLEVPEAQEVSTDINDTDRSSLVQEEQPVEEIIPEEKIEEDIIEDIPAVEEIPADEPVIEQTPAEETPVEQLQPVEEVIAEEEPAQDAPTVEETAEQEQIIEDIPAVEEQPAQEEEQPVEILADNVEEQINVFEETDEAAASLGGVEGLHVIDNTKRYGQEQAVEEQTLEQEQPVEETPIEEAPVEIETEAQPAAEEYDVLNIEKTESIEEKSVLEEFAADKQEMQEHEAQKEQKEEEAAAYLIEQANNENEQQPVQQDGQEVSALDELTGRGPALQPMAENQNIDEDQFLKTFTSSIEEVFLDQPTAIISDYVPPQVANPEIYGDAPVQDQISQAVAPAQQAGIMDLKSAPENSQQEVRSVRRIKPAAIKTVPMVAGAGEDMQSLGANGEEAAPNIDEAIAELGGSSIVLKFVKMFSALMVLLFILILFVALLATMKIIPSKFSPAHAIITKVFGDKEAEARKAKEAAIIDQATLSAVQEAEEEKKAQQQEILDKVQNYMLPEGRTLFEKIVSTHANQAPQIEWSADQTVDQNYYSIVVKLPPNNEGYSLTYRFSYDKDNSILVPTTSESNNILQAPAKEEAPAAQQQPAQPAVTAAAPTPAAPAAPTPKIKRRPAAKK